MAGKRALVVDDSKSARTFLSRLLEEHELEVDAAETAEQAIDYLTRHRPDVIFMDHLMPGMDGFQALQAIKSNPRTATIPILMYTSQEGELYLGQARALGAIGVLPKQVAPADVSTVLEQLHLAGRSLAAQAVDMGEEETGALLAPEDLQDVAAAAEAVASTHAANATTLAASLAAIPESSAIAITEDALVGLRADFERTLDERLERLLPQIRVMIRDAVPPPIEPEPPPRNRTAWALAALGLVSGLLFALLWMQQRQQVADLTARMALQSAASSPVPVPEPVPAGDSSATLVAAPSALPPVGEEVLYVPFGETPLDGVVTQRLREIVDQLAASGFTGVVEVIRHEGRFCLTGHPDMGYIPTIPSVPYLRCDLVADAGDPEVGGGPPESLGFANALADLRKAHAGKIYIGVSEATPSARDRPYPPIDGNPPRVPTAGEWNLAAIANNRVEIRWRPDP
jgi:CheY-like chemotaxis protein